MKEYKSKFKSYSIERIVNSQLHKLKTELVEMVARTPNGNAIDYTHTIDISFEERKHQILKRLAIVRKSRSFNNHEYERLRTTLARLSSVSIINHDLIAFIGRVRRKINFDAFYIIPNETHAHILLVLYQGDIKHFIRKAKERPYCWNVKYKPFATTIDNYLENKIKYLMEKEKNMKIKNYEEIIYDFYPDRKRIDSVFGTNRNMYEYELGELGKKLNCKLSNHFETV